MSINVQQRGSRHQLRVKHKLLPRAFFFTFDTEAEATGYGEQLHSLLDSGVIPSDLLLQPATPVAPADPTIASIITDYIVAAHPTSSDVVLLNPIKASAAVGEVRFSAIGADWVDRYVSGLKIGQHLAPSSIRKRIGSLGRVIDWHIRRTDSDAKNPFRTLPIGYSAYSAADAVKLKATGREVKRDEARDRRLDPRDEPAILAALAGEKNPQRQRALVPDPEFALFFRLIVNTGMRLREAYRQRIEAIDAKRRIVGVDGSKGARGIIRPRTVPVSTELMADLMAHAGERKTGLLFSFWTGDPEDMKPCTERLSRRFTTVFGYANCEDLTEHDLRHEATCRWVTYRSPGGGWLFSETEICKILGWSDTRMLLRYASLRGEDLSSRLA